MEGPHIKIEVGGREKSTEPSDSGFAHLLMMANGGEKGNLEKNPAVAGMLSDISRNPELKRSLTVLLTENSLDWTNLIFFGNDEGQEVLQELSRVFRVFYNHDKPTTKQNVREEGEHLIELLKEESRKPVN